MSVKSVGYALSVLAAIGITPLACADSPPSKAPVFQASTVLKGISISAPLSDLYSKDRAWVAPVPAQPTIAAPQDPVEGAAAPAAPATPPHQTDTTAAKAAAERPKVQGTLSFINSKGATVTLSGVEFGVRGNSSRAEDQCPFAKLTLKLPASTGAELFGKLKEIKIGTHCGESDTPAPTWGRIQNQKEPIREALIYQILNRMGAVTLRARPAVINYTDTSATLDTTILPTATITRNAFFLESEETAAERYGTKVVQETSETPPPNPVFTDAQTGKVDPKNIVISALSEALTENSDWSLKMSASDYGAFMNNWNVNILQASVKAAAPVVPAAPAAAGAPAAATSNPNPMMVQVYDWDISGWVRGPWGYGDPFMTAITRMQADPDVTPAIFAQVRADILATHDADYADLAAAFAPGANALATVDTDGQTNIQNHLDSFFKFMNCQTDISLTTCSTSP